MNLTVILLTAGFLNVCANGLAQNVSFSGKDVSLESVFSSVEHQTGFVFLYKVPVIKLSRPVSISAENIPLEQFLQEIFKSQPLKYNIKGETIFISRKDARSSDRQLNTSGLDVFSLDDTLMTVRGRIVDENGKPLAGASVSVKNSKKVGITDAEGVFSLNVNAGNVLIASFVGYQTTEYKIIPAIIRSSDKQFNPDGINIIISLSKVSTELNEVIINAGYYNTTKKLSTGSISKVSSEEIEKQPVSNPILTLGGKVPGLFINQNTGISAGDITVTIRGQNTLNSQLAAPLYIVDGVPFGSSPVEQSVGVFASTSASGLSPLNTISPSDIESITVLKDADATAIYGSRGANGVILITTKKGKSGDTKLSVDINHGIGKVTNMIKLANTEQYLNVRKQAFINDGVVPTIANAPDLLAFNQNAYTNFTDLLIGNTSNRTNVNLSVSGGDTYTQFLIGGTYRDESTVLPSKNSDKAVQFHLSLQHRSHNNKFGVTTSVSYNHDNNTIPIYNLTALNLPPNFPLYNADGSLYSHPSFTNPFLQFNATTNLKSTNVIANVGFQYNLLRGLDFKVNLGYNNINVHGASITPTSSSNPNTNATPLAILNNNYIETYITEPQLNYTHKFGKGILTALLGGSLQHTETIQPYFLLGSFPYNAFSENLGTLTILSKSSGFADYKYVSGFSRLTYNLDNKYLVSGNLRRDGSSRFGSGNKFGMFGSIAAAWIFSNEPFAENNMSWLSHGKLKVSYGTIGSDKISDYTYDATYSSIAQYGTAQTLNPSRIANEYVQWEVTKKFDVAIELEFLESRLAFTLDLYRNRSNNLLGNDILPSQTGFSAYTANLPAVVQNQGIELELTGKVIKNKNFSWNTSFNLTLPQNKLLSFPNLKNSTYADTYVVGKSLRIASVYHFTGFVNGIASVQDLNRSGIVDPGLFENGRGDRLVEDVNPKMYGGLSNTLTYKRLQLDILLQGIARRAKRGDLFAGNPYPGRNANIPASLLDLPIKYSQMAGSPAINAWPLYTGSDAAYTDASFMRLKNLSLSYKVSSDWTRWLKMSSINIYVHAQNLLTITSYKGADPETLGGLPVSKVFVIGFNATF